MNVKKQTKKNNGVVTKLTIKELSHVTGGVKRIIWQSHDGGVIAL